MKTSKKENVLDLTKEELIEKLLQAQKETAIQHDLLKETFHENKALQKKCAELEKKLAESVGEGYKNASSWVSKIVFVLKKENKPLRSIDLISILEKTEPVLQNHLNKAKVFSAFINSAVKHRRIIPQKVKGVRGYYYLLPDWIEEGIIKQPHKGMLI